MPGLKITVKNFPVVCVGDSAGGLDAYTRLLRHLPDEGVAGRNYQTPDVGDWKEASCC